MPLLGGVMGLFSGIGGFEIACELAGLKIMAMAEIEESCRAVLEYWFPKAHMFHDVRDIGGWNGEKIDVITGGFPCQDISWAGKGEGIEGSRSGLWGEMCRIIGLIRPRYVIVENTASITRRGLLRVLGDLARIGYDAEWEVISAAAFGAPHIRSRLYLVSYPDEKHGGKGLGNIFKRALPIYTRVRKECHEVWKKTTGNLDSVADGVSGKLYYLAVAGLGNAVIPQVVYPLAAAIKEALEGL